MAYTRYIDICSRSLTQYQKVKDNSTRENQTPAVLCRIYIGNYSSEGLGDGGSTATLYYPGCRPAVIQRIFNVPKYASWNPGAFIDQIDIELRDDVGNLLYIPGDPNRSEELNAVRSNNQFQLTLLASESWGTRLIYPPPSTNKKNKKSLGGCPPLDKHLVGFQLGPENVIPDLVYNNPVKVVCELSV